MTLAPAAPPPGEPEPSRLGTTTGRELLEIAGLLIGLGGAAWLWAELSDRLRQRVAARLEN